MNTREFFIKNKSPLMQTMLVAGIFLLFELFTGLNGNNPFSEWGPIDYVFVPISIVVIIVDAIDFLKIRYNKLMVCLEDDGVRILSYMFSNRYIPYSEMTEVNLRQKDISYTRNGKLRTIGGPSQSDLIRIMKVLHEKING